MEKLLRKRKMNDDSSVKHKKRKVNEENRNYQKHWEFDYLITNLNERAQCLVCLQIVAVYKEYNIKRHYTSNHVEKFQKYEGDARKLVIQDLKKNLQQQTGPIFKLTKPQLSALHASYAVSLLLAKAKKPFSDGPLMKQCAVKMVEAFGGTKMVENLELIPLSHQTVQRRVVEMGEFVEKSLCDRINECVYFSLALDESTGESDVSQLLISIRAVDNEFAITEEVFDVCALHGTTKGEDIFKAVQTSVQKIGGFTKCTAILTDGAPAMVGSKYGLIGHLRRNGVTCPAFHCIIHQEALCGKSVKQKEVLKLVVKVINMMRGGNRALMHRKLKTFLQESEAEYQDSALYNNVRWLSAGTCLQRFFGVRKLIPAFLKEHMKSDTSEIRSELESPDFLKELAFLTDILGHMNELNVKLQGRNQFITDLFGHINGFRSKLGILKSALQSNDITHFPCCNTLAAESEGDEGIDFSEFQGVVQSIADEFTTRFQEFQKMNDLLFSNLMNVDVKKHTSNLQLELCDLQADLFLQSRPERGSEFFKLISQQQFPNLRRFALRISSMFGSTYICESTFTTLKFIKNRNRTCLTDTSLLNLLRLGTTKIEVDIPSLVKTAERPQLSH